MAIKVFDSGRTMKIHALADLLGEPRTDIACRMAAGERMKFDDAKVERSIGVNYS
ncbi:hypothetical protein KZX46_12955 [Polymorphobacter sp. PAMC 29334]|uniref:hypothetical protein n=1 Tax=Polymorphobacter sp. PAMC 29334 TaxID=2862331 RepID=UPI001C76ADC5|nr:hypothetical protein [Polymorphobacter sp. PAMC 29334]QYE33750.1 hypothetical protein KZX46_12955 [Polymorphobacter sp. PAMC 29334]